MPLKIGTPLPTLDGAVDWINGAVALNELVGHIVLVDFWAISCPFCLFNMPRLHAWRDAYYEQGLRIVTVHLPRKESDKSIELVQSVAEAVGLTEPIALDHEGVIGRRFETNGAWPYYFLFDAQGAMRSRAAGEVGLNLLENTLKRLLALSETP